MGKEKCLWTVNVANCISQLPFLLLICSSIFSHEKWIDSIVIQLKETCLSEMVSERLNGKQSEFIAK